jgi:hypothetical protein
MSETPVTAGITNTALAERQQGDHMRGMTEQPKPAETQPETKPEPKLPKEIGGPTGPEPTRYGDWEKNGRCSDF